ncbi:MAG: N-succinylarginine dihydrolase [Parachlamydiaceae bacterium]
MDNSYEINFDGIVGPTHNYGGLSYGNVASLSNRNAVSNPREAALQGLDKMKFLADKGVKQAVLPPQERPHLPTLRALGFSGTDHAIITKAYEANHELLAAVTSAASMWTANAATVCPSADSMDHKVHFTPANLSSKFHRSIEPSTTSQILRKIFADPEFFTHHSPLPTGDYVADEGAANHTRFCRSHGGPGVQLFVYGRDSSGAVSQMPKLFPARQTVEASHAIARLHGIQPGQTIFAQQNPEAIDAGVFHNDVISVGNENLFLYHEKAFLNASNVIKTIQDKVQKCCDTQMIFLEIKEKDIPLSDAVSSYLFNSQIITLPHNNVILIAPIECQENPRIHACLDSIVRSPMNPISEVCTLNLRQSMRNGGGPACLRLRVVLTPQELAAVNPNVMLNDTLYNTLKKWINKYYRDRLEPKDIADPKLSDEGHLALDELTQILNLGSLYNFQKKP